MSDDGYLTTADALVYLGTTQRTLYRRLAKGEIPAVRFGQQWRFRKSDLDRWIAQQSGSRPAAVEPAAVDDAAATTAPALRKPRVLVADDEPGVCESLNNILALSDCDVETVADGALAVGRLRAASYDLVITDLRMPGLDGIQVAREAKRLQPGVKVVIITGYPSQSSAIDAVNLGVDGYVTKPFRAMDVLIATARALDLGGSGSQSGVRS